MSEVKFPVSLHASVPIGKFEMLFNKNPNLIYKVGSSDRESHRCHAYFIREIQWNNIVLQLSRSKEGAEALEKLKDNTLIQYYEHIYAPIKNHQEEDQREY